jgi:Protein of unknown function (DUF3341)
MKAMKIDRGVFAMRGHRRCRGPLTIGRQYQNPSSKGEESSQEKNMAGRSIFGLFTNRQKIEAAVQALRDAGFRGSDISILAPENLGDIRDIGTVKVTKAPEGATAGGTFGGVIGGVLGWLIGIGTLVIPRFGTFLAAGPVMVVLAGLGVGAVLGGLVGALIGLGIPEFEAKRYETRLNKGGILLSVHADNKEWISRAKTILGKTGAEQVSSVAESRVA